MCCLLMKMITFVGDERFSSKRLQFYFILFLKEENHLFGSGFKLTFALDEGENEFSIKNIIYPIHRELKQTINILFWEKLLKIH